MRTERALKNISINILYQIVIVILGFISRKVFLDNLGTEYLGVNGLLGNVLSAMVLIESGFGISIVYNLYKPLAENNKEQIIALIQLYKKVYFILASILLLISISLYPFLENLIKSDGNVPYLGVVYIIFVSKSIASYIYQNKWALINADQRGYKLTKNNIIFQVVSLSGKIIILKVTQNYIAYLLIEFILFIMQNYIGARIVNKLYPYLKTKEKYKIDADVRTNIVSNVKAMFIQNIGSYAIYSTDNILISYLISVSTVGLYSNYSLITDQLNSLVSQFVGGISNSVGNLIATENEEKSYFIFRITFMISFWIYSVSSIFLFNLLEPFINWWLGTGYLLNKLTFWIIIINFYISGMRKTITIFKDKAGLFAQDKYVAIIEGIINLVVSIYLGKRIGLVGIFLGTSISFLVTSFWNQPRILFKYYFTKQSVFKYMITYIKYIFLTILVGMLTQYICKFIILKNSFLGLVVNGFICILIPSSIYYILFKQSKEFQYLSEIMKVMVCRSIKNKEVV